MVMDPHRQPPAEAGLKQLCLSLHGELRRFLLARRVSEIDADDLLQDLFIRLETTATGPIRAPRAYLYQMLNNLAHLRRRTEGRREVRDGAWLYHQTEGNAAPDPETVLLARDHLARVRDQLEELPERTRYIFRQYRIAGLSQKTIAHELGISLSAVEKHLQRAYRTVIEIRQNLEGADQETGRDKGGSGDAIR
jgi:RNA polymerase sigma factor (sigma-70 family)